MLEFLGKLSLGLVLGFGGIGSCLGMRAAGMAATAAWAKEGKEGKPLAGIYNGLIGMPFSQTIYCIILYLSMQPYAATPENGAVLFGITLGVGMCELYSAFVQGQIGAAGIRCMSENGGKGLGPIVVAMGIAESVGLFAMVIGIVILRSDIIVKAAEVATGL